VSRKIRQNDNIAAFSLIELLIVVAIIGVLGAVVIPDVVGLTGRAMFKVEYLEVTPNEVMSGNEVTVTATLKNLRDEAGNYTLTLNVDGNAVYRRIVELRANASETVSLKYLTDQPGSHEVDLKGVKRKFTTIPTGILPQPDPTQLLEIISPEDGTIVSWQCKIEGIIQGNSSIDELNVYILVFPISSNGRWWVQPSVILEADRHWETYAYFGEDPRQSSVDSGNLFYVVAIVTDQKLQVGEMWYSIPDYMSVSNVILVRRQ